MNTHEPRNSHPVVALLILIPLVIGAWILVGFLAHAVERLVLYGWNVL